MRKLSSYTSFLAPVVLIILAGCGGSSELTATNTDSDSLAQFEGEAKHDVQRSLAIINANLASGKSNANLEQLKNQIGLDSTRLIARLKVSSFKNVSPGLQIAQQKAAITSELVRTGFKPLSVFSISSGRSARGESSKNTVEPSDVQFATFDIKDTGLTARQAMDRLMSTGLIEYIEVDAQQKKLLAPNDTNYGQQWHLKNTLAGGIPGADINVEVAWNTNTGSGNQVVAVIDDGLLLSHPDFAGNIWTNPLEVANDGIDNDGNGIVDDVNGADVVLMNGNVNPYNRDASDHGTQVAGTIAARGNNSAGVTGVNWSAKIMVLKIEGPDTGNAQTAYSTYTSDIVKSINYVVARKQAGVNVRVINISYGGLFYSQSYKDALLAAMNNGILVVIAAGNDGTDDTLSVGYPSRYRLPNVISVGSLTRNNERSSFSNYGSYVHLFAPGSEIYTTSSRPTAYTSTNGTSFASPIVAGAAALIWDQYPSLNWEQVKSKLLNTAADANIPASPSFDTLTRGRLNVGSAIASSGPTCVIKAPSKISLADMMVAGANHVVRAWLPCTQYTSSVTYSLGGIETVLKDDGAYPDEYANDGIFSAVFRAPNTLGTQNSRLIHSYNTGAGNQTMFSNQVVTVRNTTNYAYATTPYSWEPLTGATPIAYTNYDEGAASISLPFVFNYEGRNVSQVVVATNGYVCIKPGMNASRCSTDIGSLPFPSGKGYLFEHGIIAPWADDWYFPVGADVYTKTVGAAPNRQFVITWSNATHYNQISTAAGAGVSFQLALYEGSGSFEFRYSDTTVEGGMYINPTNNQPHFSPSGGATGSSGIQMAGGSMGTRHFYQGAGLVTNSMAVRWSPTTSSFADVNPLSVFASSIETLKGSYVTNGCGANNYCPTNLVTRAEMAAFISRAAIGHDLLFDYSSIPSANFTDVLSSSVFSKYINTMKALGITNGCGNGTTYCPSNNVTRQEMAAFIVRASRGSTFVPQAATGIYADVNTNSTFAKHIEEIHRMGVTTGCGSGNYCPTNKVTRAEMAAFLQRAFLLNDYE
jgi:subtilisin family serine protease